MIIKTSNRPSMFFAFLSFKQSKDIRNLGCGQLIIKKLSIKGSSDASHFIFEINVGKSRIRHTTTLKLSNEFLDRLKIEFRVVLCRIRFFPRLNSKNGFGLDYP